MNSSENHTGYPAHIFIVVADTVLAPAITRSLRAAGYYTTTLSNGRDALHLIESVDIDGAMVDATLDGEDGFSVADAMKRRFGDENFTPVIMLLNGDDERDRIKGMEHADGYIVKPFAEAELLAQVKSMVRIRRLQRELMQSRNRYRFLYQNIPEMCISIDERGRIWDSNIAFDDALGEAHEAVVGTNIFERIEPREREAFEKYCESLRCRCAQPHRQVFQLCGSDTVKKVSLRGAYTGAGGPSIVLVMQDITQSLQHEEEQKMARRQLYRSAQIVSIGTLASGVAHELNNPLAAILGFADALVQRFENNEPVAAEELRQYLGIIKSESIRCRDIIDNLLKFSRDREPQIRDISLLDCIHTACTLLASRAAKKRIEIRNLIQADVLIRADVQRMGQVFLNVLANAIDFSPEDSAVTIEINPEHTGRHVTIRITDTGPGIAPDILPRIFDPFFTTKEVGQGTGIGLSICHKAMEECEGLIDVISEQGKGTTVVLEIPRGGTLK